MEYIVIDPNETSLRYSILIGQAPGDWPAEDYGVTVTRLADGVSARAEHAADSPAAIQRLVNRLMNARVEPEELLAALGR